MRCKLKKDSSNIRFDHCLNGGTILRAERPCSGNLGSEYLATNKKERREVKFEKNESTLGRRITTGPQVRKA